MSSRSTGRGVVWIRRLTQVVFFGLFVATIVAARPHASEPPSSWLKLYFLFDPLILLATLLTTHTFVGGALLALVTLVLTAVLGRVFCGWICPLGTLHAAAGRLLFWLWPDRKRRDHWSAWQRGKYYVLVGFLALAALGGHWVCVFDPLVLLYRSTVTAVMPGIQWAVEESSTTVYQRDPGVGPVRLVKVTEPTYTWLRDHVFVVQHQAFWGGTLILLFFVGTLLLNRFRPRFWCRYVCPLGALLGLFARWPLLRRRTTQTTCNQCDLCAMACHGAAAAAPGDQWKPAECFGCMNCTPACRRESMHFTLAVPWRKEPGVATVDLRKRTLLVSAAAGAAGLYAFRTTPEARGQVYNPLLIRPPGSRAERDFLQRCTACGLCMKVCPTGGLQPTLLEAGLEGLWTPRLVPHLGHCDFECTACGHVCPTEAIRPLAVEEKQKTRIGLAAFDVTRCIPYAYGRECMVCEEHCPIPDKAIYSLEVEIVDREGNRKKIRQPHVDSDKCIGCGICMHVCPFRDRPGIYVSSANESRHPDNQPMLPSDGVPY